MMASGSCSLEWLMRRGFSLPLRPWGKMLLKPQKNWPVVVSKVKGIEVVKDAG